VNNNDNITVIMIISIYITPFAEIIRPSDQRVCIAICCCRNIRCSSCE